MRPFVAASTPSNLHLNPGSNAAEPLEDDLLSGPSLHAQCLGDRRDRCLFGI